MEKRSTRVSEAQWDMLLDFLEDHPCLVKSRGYNNSSKGRARSARLWAEIADLLNADRIGTKKNPKDWSIYISNYKSRLKKMIADTNDKEGGSPQEINLSDQDRRFLAILGKGFGQTGSKIKINPFIKDLLQLPSTSGDYEDSQDVSKPNKVNSPEENNKRAEEDIEKAINIDAGDIIIEELQFQEINSPDPGPSMPQQTRHRRFRSRPLAPIAEARRILSQVEMQQAADDAAHTRALDVLGKNLGRIADSLERFVAYITRP